MSKHRSQRWNSEDNIHPSSAGGDLNFSENSRPADEPAPAESASTAEPIWQPSPILPESKPPQSRPEPVAESSSPGVGDTWVPEDGLKLEGDPEAAADSHSDPSSNAASDVDVRDNSRPLIADETVIFDHPQASETALNSDHDPLKTVVPADAPALADRAAENDRQRSDSDITSSDSAHPQSNVEDDVNKTWVPSRTPTHHDFSFEAAAQADSDSPDDDDPNRTWVPSSIPTEHGMDAPRQSSAKATDDQTDQESETVPGNVFAFGEQSQDPTGGTVVIPEDDEVRSSDSAVLDTVPGQFESEADKTDVFTRTMAMRGQNADEYDEWRNDVAELDASDTAVHVPPVGDSAARSPSGRGTQIWSRASMGGVDLNLTIRRRPVAGEHELQQDKSSDQPDYHIIEKLAEGGMGAIFIARQTSLDRELAIKTLKPLKAHERRAYTSQGRMDQVERQRREMFLSEALVTANLVHPHIIPIHDLCQTVDGAPFYSMKRVNGIPWNEHLKKMSLEENLEVLDKVCDAMAYAHHNGVVNRDLKPENIMLGEFGEVLVLDWGLAVPASVADKSRFSSPSASYGAGTPAYMSPELWTGPADAIGTWSDIYLLGGILFEVLTGQTPHTFPEPDSSAGSSGLWNVIDSVVRHNEIRDTDAQGELIDIAMKAMSANPESRHRTVLEFQEDIKQYLRHEESRRLAHRAEQTLAEARDSKLAGGYQNYQTAAALFEEAHAGWSGNTRALDGLTQTRLDYANLALAKGDFDLGLQVAATESGTEFEELTHKLTRARRIRNRLKYAVITASAAVVLALAVTALMGVHINQQNKELVALNGTKEELETQTQLLSTDKQRLEEESRTLLADKQKLQDESLALTADNAELQNQNQTLAQETSTLKNDKQQLLTEQQQLISDKQKLSSEVTALEADTQRLADSVARLEVDTARLTEEKIRAGVELRNADIANLIRNADYASALREVEDLLVALKTDETLGTLPESEREQRLRELEAREQQLQKRILRTSDPVQTQAISSSGKTVVWGDAAGTLTLRQVDAASGKVSDQPTATLKLKTPVSSVSISRNEQLIVAAAGAELHLWFPADQQHYVLTGHQAAIVTVRLANDFLLAADDSGVIRAWDLKTRTERWSIRSLAAIRDLVIMPQAGMFLYAGSRGGESADVLAYQLPPANAPESRPVRLGQLQFPRNKTHPPRRISVSPDEQLLLVSNSRNGDVLALPRRSADQIQGRDRFPFVHATLMDEQSSAHWVLDHHQRPVNDITFSSDGGRVATASDDRAVGVWLVQNEGKLIFEKRLEGHGARVNAVGFLDAAGKQLLSAGADRFCRLWDLDRYQQNRRETEALFNLSAIDSSVHTRRGRPVAAPTRSRYLLTNLPTETTEAEAAESHQNPIVARTQSEPKTAPTTPQPEQDDYRVLNVDQARQRGSLKSLAISQDGNRVVTGAADGTAVIWDAASGRPVTGVSTRSRFESASGTFQEGHDFNVAKLRFVPPNGNLLLTTGFDGNLCLWNANVNRAGSGGQETRIEGLGLVNAVAASPDGELIATSVAAVAQQRSGSAMVFRTSDLMDRTAPNPTMQFTGFHQAEVSALAFSPDGRQLATGARDGRVAVWSVSTGQLLAFGSLHAKNTIVGHLEWLSNSQLLSAGFDGLLLIVASASKPLEFIDDDAANSEVVPERLVKQTIFRHDHIPIERVAVSNDRQRIVTVSVRTDPATDTTTSELHLWHINQQDAVRRIRPAILKQRAGDRISAVTWSGDDQQLAAVVDGNLHVFETRSWRIQTVLQSPDLGISDAVFAPSASSGPSAADDSPDKLSSPNVIATFDGTAAHLWDLNTRSHLLDFRPLYAVNATALAGDAQRTLLLTGDRAIRIFHASPSSPEFGQTLFKINHPHDGIVTSLQFAPHPTANVFLSAGADGSVALWKWDADQQLATCQARLDIASFAVNKTNSDTAAAPPSAVRSPVAATSWTPDGGRFLVATASGRVAVFDANNTDHPVADIRVEDAQEVKISAAEFSPTGRFLAVAGQVLQSGQSAGWIYDLQPLDAPELHAQILGHEAGGIRCLAFVAESPYIVTGGADGAALIWNWQPERADEDALQAYEAFQLLTNNTTVAHPAPVTAVVASRNGRIVTASDDGTAIVWRNPLIVIQ